VVVRAYLRAYHVEGFNWTRGVKEEFHQELKKSAQAKYGHKDKKEPRSSHQQSFQLEGGNPQTGGEDHARRVMTGREAHGTGADGDWIRKSKWAGIVYAEPETQRQGG